jgi:dihydrofolate synthase/folylpolyglutamate synthase
MAEPPANAALGDWLNRLENISAHEIDLGLERVEAVLERLAIKLPDTVFHVAGTNGKGSCAALLESLLRAGGRNVGCYTSPHVHRYNERIRINGTEAADASLVRAFERIEAVREDVPLTYFEAGTLAALWVFAEEHVDIAILEVGLGGRLDAVNAVDATAVLITNVTLDHCDWLGPDVESIAYEKAGVMRAGRPAVFGGLERPKAICDEAKRIGADLRAAGRDYSWSAGRSSWNWSGRGHRLEGLCLPALPGEHQFANAAAVFALLEAAGLSSLLQVDIVDAALAGLALAGRMQTIDADPRILLDVAHNPASAQALADTLLSFDRPGRTVVVLGMLADKDVEAVVQPLSRVADDWIAVTAASPRAIAAGELARRVANLTNRACLVAGSIGEAMQQASSTTEADDRILVTGSFYVVGPVLQLYSPRKQ